MLINNNCYSCIVSNFGKYLSISVKIEALNIAHNTESFIHNYSVTKSSKKPNQIKISLLSTTTTKLYGMKVLHKSTKWTKIFFKFCANQLSWVPYLSCIHHDFSLKFSNQPVCTVWRNLATASLHYLISYARKKYFLKKTP